MVPSSTSLQAPYFPQCVEWIMQNQQDNGSWGINEFASSVSKDILLSTLACVIALKKWNVGLEQIWRGLHFIGRNMPIVMDEQITTPNGFNLTFPSMIRLAIQIGLEFPVRQADVDEILRLREMELKRLEGEKYSARETYLSYVADGSVNLLDWNEVMKFQRKNGSLFNSPSTTAAALVQKYDDNALQYLQFLLNTFGSAVPLTYPRNIYYQLSMLDTLQKLGISHRFSSEINGILDRTYRWDEPREDAFHSEQVKILYTALYSTVNHLGAKASAVQNRDVTQLPVEMWQKGMRCMMTESEWQRAKYAPTVEEYMANSTVSIVVDLMLLPAKYFLGEMISDYMVKHEEYNELRRLMSTICRLLNDTRTVERESAAGKLNSVALLALHSGGFLSIEEAQKVVNKSIAECRRELLQLVLREDSVVPRSCKELFWKHCKTAFWFYFQADGLTSPKEMVAEVNALFNEPLKLQTSNPSLSDQPK
ncbi:hypothetical protein ACQ4PT_034136 [Festuca glaucescens]